VLSKLRADPLQSLLPIWFIDGATVDERAGLSRGCHCGESLFLED
jgi:hypothetical protein